MKKLLFFIVLLFLTVFSSETFAASGSGWKLHYVVPWNYPPSNSSNWELHFFVSGLPVCVCPTSGNWEIKAGEYCNLVNVCRIIAGDVHIKGGGLNVAGSGTLVVPPMHQLIIERVNSTLSIDDGGKVVIEN
jgi:hypothetical protein